MLIVKNFEGLSVGLLLSGLFPRIRFLSSDARLCTSIDDS